MMPKFEEAQQTINRLIDDDYDGSNADILRMMDLNEIASHIQQTKDRFDDIGDSVAELRSLWTAQSSKKDEMKELTHE